MIFEVGIKKLWIAILFAASIASPAESQEILYELVDSGVLEHSVHGQGIEMRIKPSAMPQGGLQGEVVKEALVHICRHYAPSVIPFVIEQANISDPQFVSVRVVSGNSTFGRYILQVYTIKNGTCGSEL